MLFHLGVKELCSKGVKTLPFSFILLHLGKLEGAAFSSTSPPLGEVGRGLVFAH